MKHLRRSAIFFAAMLLGCEPGHQTLPVKIGYRVLRLVQGCEAVLHLDGEPQAQRWPGPFQLKSFQ